MKSCCVKLIPLDPNILHKAKLSDTQLCKSEIPQPGLRVFKDSPVPVKRNLQSSFSLILDYSDLFKLLKPCRVVLERQDFKISNMFNKKCCSELMNCLPSSKSKMSCAKLKRKQINGYNRKTNIKKWKGSFTISISDLSALIKPCSVTLPSLNSYGLINFYKNISFTPKYKGSTESNLPPIEVVQVPESLNVMKPCSVSLQQISSDNFDKNNKSSVSKEKLLLSKEINNLILKENVVNFSNLNAGSQKKFEGKFFEFGVNDFHIHKSSTVIFPEQNIVSVENCFKQALPISKNVANEASLGNNLSSYVNFSASEQPNKCKQTDDYYLIPNESLKYHSNHSLKRQNIPESATFLYDSKVNYKKNIDKPFQLFDEKISHKLYFSENICKENRGQYLYHSSERLNDPNLILYRCFQCYKALPSLKALYYHTCKEKQKRGFMCKFCEKYFDFYHALKKHKKTHVLKKCLSSSEAIEHRNRIKICKENSALKIEKKLCVKSRGKSSCQQRKSAVLNIKDKKNSSHYTLKPRKLKKIILENLDVASTSTGFYSSNNEFLSYILNPDDSDTEF